MGNRKIELYNEVVKNPEILNNPVVSMNAQLWLEQIGEKELVPTVAETFINSFSIIVSEQKEVEDDILEADVAMLARAWRMLDQPTQEKIEQVLIEKLQSRPIPMKKDAVAIIQSQNSVIVTMFEDFKRIIANGS